MSTFGPHITIIETMFHQKMTDEKKGAFIKQCVSVDVTLLLSAGSMKNDIVAEINVHLYFHYSKLLKWT